VIKLFLLKQSASADFLNHYDHPWASCVKLGIVDRIHFHAICWWTAGLRQSQQQPQEQEQ
jgi:hypothetical protein